MNILILRPYGSKIGAWASHQSEKLSSRQELEDRVHEYAAKIPK
jgi:pyridoxamine 5'-phosphate oxidase